MNQQMINRNDLHAAHNHYYDSLRAAMEAITEFASLSSWQYVEIASRLLYALVPKDTPNRNLIISALTATITALHPEENYYEYKRRHLLADKHIMGDIPF